MSQTKSTFWRNLTASQLLSSEAIESLQNEFPEGTPDLEKRVCKRCIETGLLTRYQAQILLGGKRAQFIFGDFVVTNKIAEAPLRSTYSAQHRSSGHAVTLRLLADPASGEQANQTQHNSTQYNADQIVQHINSIAKSLLGVHEPCLIRPLFAFKHGEQVVVISDPIHATQTLETAVSKGEASLAQRVQWVEAICRGAGALHQLGLFHGNIRPTNIFLHDDSASLYLDPVGESWSSPASSSGAIRPQTYFLAPEIPILEASPSPITDIYSLGTLFYYVLSGRVPFEGQSEEEIVSAHASQPIVPLAEFTTHAALGQFVTYMMAKKPELRYQRADIVADQMRQYLSSISSFTPPLPPAKTWSSFQVELDEKLREVVAVAAQPTSPSPQTAQATTASSAASIATPTAQQQSQPVVASANSSDIASVSRNASQESYNSPTRILQERQRAKKRNRIIMAVLAAVVLIGGIAGYAWLPKDLFTTADKESKEKDGDKETESKETEKESSDKPSKAIDTSIVFNQEVVPDDGAMLWESPTQGKSLPIAYLANDPIVIIDVKPNAVLKSEDGQLLVRALGPDFQDRLDEWQNLSGLAFDQAKHVRFSLHDVDGKPQVCIYVELLKATELSKLAESWGVASAALPKEPLKPAAGKLDWSYATVKSEGTNVREFLMGSAKLVAEACENTEKPATISLPLRQLVQHADGDRHFNMVFAGVLLDGAATPHLLPGSLDLGRLAVSDFLGTGVQAGSFSFHLDQELFVELQLKGDVSRPGEVLAADIGDGLTQAQSKMEMAVSALSGGSYWEVVRLRYVNWFRELITNTRVSTEDKLMIANCWLPSAAAHNIAAATEVTLAAMAKPPASVTPTVTAKVPTNIDELLAYKFDFSVAQDDLVNVMGALEQTVLEKLPELPFAFDLKLSGNDLMEEGITQNQKVANFSATGMALSEILTQIMITANPDKAAKGPDDRLHKLIWVVGPTDDPMKQQVLITTKKAAEKMKYTVPPVFGVIETTKKKS